MNKPYLLYIYDLQQSLQFIKETSGTCVDRDIKSTKQQHFEMSKQVLQYITKYNLPTSIQGTPQWNKTQLQDLFVMVEQFGMPYFFLTLTIDETSTLHWEEINNIEETAKSINSSMTWKDCSIDYATLFHAHIQKLMQQYILCANSTLASVKQHIICYEVHKKDCYIHI